MVAVFFFFIIFFFVRRLKFCNNKRCINRLNIYIYIKGVDVVEWSRALDVRLSEWCCSVTMVWVQIPSREEQKFDSSKI